MKIVVPSSNLPRVVIIGGGFAGIETAKALAKKSFQVVLIDKNNFHTFQPLLYQVATGGLEADSIVFPLRKIFNKARNFYFRMAQVQRIIPEQNLLETDVGEINYDYLVIASGSMTNFFGMEKIREHGLPMKSVVEALNMRSFILQNFEQVVTISDPAQQELLMNYVIVGGGPTGVELAGALGELKRNVLPCDYPELDIRRMNIYLIESAPRLLATMEKESSEQAAAFLKELDVNVMLGTGVTEYDGMVVKTNKGQEIHTSTLIWTAGVMGAHIQGLDANAVTQGGRIKTDAYNRVTGYANIFAIGDVAAIQSEQLPKGHPMVAQVAIQQGKNLAKNFERLAKKQPLLPFQYNDKGSMATIGRNRAVAEIKKFKSQGFFAWFLWMAVHLMSLIGFRNKMVVFINWVWSYFNYDKGMRLIIRPFRRQKILTKDQWNISEKRQAS